MIQIRRIHSAALTSERNQIAQVQEILKASFSDVELYADRIPHMLDNPFQYSYRTILLVSRSANLRVTGFSLILHFHEINSSFLDFLASHPEIKGSGLGSALYEATREILQRLGSRGMYLEAFSDDPEVIRDTEELEENRKRLKFYEYYGVYPIIGTAYETPIDDSPAPYLLFDGLGRTQPLRRAECRAAVRLIHERKYRHIVNRDYVERIARSIIDDPVRSRGPRYVRTEPRIAPEAGHVQPDTAFVSTSVHRIHHVRERGYVERPARIEALEKVLESARFFERVRVREHGEKPIREVHDADLVSYLKRVCDRIAPSRPIYPYVFPIRRPERKPTDLAVRAGYYCIDTFTPLDQNAYRAARGAIDVALTAAEEVLGGRRVVYALCRPPGHHAGRRVFGGFCYFNNAAIAAQFLSKEGRTAILDIDFHHGNGTQDIFWNRGDVLTVSLHGHPNLAYPYFSGFSDEVGEGTGRGFNRNFPLPLNCGESAYENALTKALEAIERFKPIFLIVSLGYDTMKGDPTGSFALGLQSVQRVGHEIAALGKPLLIVQEGGYSLRNLRRGCNAFFRGVTMALAVRERAERK